MIRIPYERSTTSGATSPRKRSTLRTGCDAPDAAQGYGMGALEVSEQPRGIYLALKILYRSVTSTYNCPLWSYLYPSKTDVTKGLQSLIALS